MASWNCGSLGGGRVTSLRGERRERLARPSERSAGPAVPVAFGGSSQVAVPASASPASTADQRVNEDLAASAPPGP